MAEPWKCPECGTWMRADISEHRCDPGGSVGAQPTAGPWVPSAVGGSGGLMLTPSPPYTVTNPLPGSSSLTIT